MSQKTERFNAIMNEAVSNFQALDAVAKNKLFKSFPMFGDKVRKDIKEANVFEVICEEMKSFGVIDGALYIALRKGGRERIQDREIIAVAKYTPKGMRYVAGSDRKQTIPFIDVDDENNDYGDIVFLSDPMDIYLAYGFKYLEKYNGSFIMLPDAKKISLDKYTQYILEHTKPKIDGNTVVEPVPLLCFENDVDKITPLLESIGFSHIADKKFRNDNFLEYELQPYPIAGLIATIYDYKTTPSTILGIANHAELEKVRNNSFTNFMKTILKDNFYALSASKRVYKVSNELIFLHDIEEAFQPRIDHDTRGTKEFTNLVDSIKEFGIINPLIVVKEYRSVVDTGEGEDGLPSETTETFYKIIDGHRRFAAAKEIRLDKIPVVIQDVTEQQANLFSIISNTERKNLTPIELGLVYQKLIDDGLFKNKRELAKKLSINESTLASTINHLKLDKSIIDDLIANKTLSDQKILKSIRTIEKVDENGVSEKQWEAYQHITSHSLGRADALTYIKELKGQSEVIPYQVKSTTNGIRVDIDTRGLAEDKVSQIQELLDQIKTLRGEN